MDVSDFPVFQGLNPTQIHNFTAACETETFPAGTQIITRGERGDKVYILLQGQLRVFLDDAGNHELAEFGPGAIFGEMELLTGQPRVATVRSETEVEVWALPFETVRARIRDSDAATLKVMFNVAKILATRLAATVGQLADIDNGKTDIRSEDLRDFRRKLFSDWTF